MTDVFMIGGPAGSGKTTLGVALADRLRAPFLDLDDATIDVVTRFRAAHPDLTEAQALSQVRLDRYGELARQARRILQQDRPSALVLIAPFTSEATSADRWREWVAEIDAREDDVHLVWLVLPPEVRRERLATRGASRDAELLERSGADRPVPAAPVPQVAHLAVDALMPTESEIDLVVQRFGNGVTRA